MTRRATIPSILGLTTALLCSAAASAQHSTAATHPVANGRVVPPAHPRSPGHPSASRGSAPANDECANATPFTVVPQADCGTALITGTTVGAVTSQGDPACTSSETGYADVWYVFNSGDHAEVTIDMHPVDMGDWGFVLQTACDLSTEVACFYFPNGPTPVVVTPNTDYLLRCFSKADAGPGEFTLCVSYAPFAERPANDECANAAPINVVDVTQCGMLATAGTTLGTVMSQDDPSCWDSDVGFADVWYTFNSGDNTEVYVTIDRDEEAILSLGFALQLACDPTTEVFCSGVTWNTVTVPVQPNTDYLLRCFNGLDYGVRGDFTLCVGALPVVPVPANDRCTDVVPEALAVGAQLTFNGDVSGATSTDDAVPGSAFEGEAAVWHAFTTTECADVLVSYCGTQALFGNVYLVLSPSCPIGDDAVFNHSWANACDNGNTEIFFAQLPPGTYYLPVMRDYPAGSYGTYDITVSAASCTAPPVNDRCADVVPVTIPVGTSHTFEGTLTGATDTGDYAPGSIWEGSNAAVWHAFTTDACADITLSYCGGLPIGDYYRHLVVACPATSDSLAGEVSLFECMNGNLVMRFYGVPAGTYYIPVRYDSTTNAIGPYELEVITEPCPLPPANDECLGAIQLVPGDTCNAIDATTLVATQSLPPTVCTPQPAEQALDVWFSFVANSTHETVTVLGHDLFDAIMQLYTGSCGALDSLDCADATIPFFQPRNEVIERGDFVVGQTYFVRVYGFAWDDRQNTDFGICVVSSDGTGIVERPAAALFGVYPNPSTGDVTLSYAGDAGRGTVELFDLTGRMITGMQRELRTGQQVPLDLGGRIAVGTYVLRLTVNGMRSEQRLVIQ